MLGACYFSGVGVRRDVEQAVLYWKMAAAKGEPRAQTNLGFCYESGVGVERQDPVRNPYTNTPARAIAIATLSRLVRHHHHHHPFVSSEGGNEFGVSLFRRHWTLSGASADPSISLCVSLCLSLCLALVLAFALSRALLCAVVSLRQRWSNGGIKLPNEALWKRSTTLQSRTPRTRTSAWGGWKPRQSTRSSI